MPESSKRELSAEFLGTFVLLVFGLGVNAQVTLSSSEVLLPNGLLISRSGAGDYLSINFGWGLAVMFGVYVAGPTSGGHLNPAVTLAMAVFRRFSWRKVVPFIAVQMVAAIIASSVVFVTYREAFENFEKRQVAVRQEAATETETAFNAKAAQDAAKLKTASIFGTYPQEFLSTAGGLTDQIVGTALLLLCIAAVSDPRNSPPAANLGPLVVGSSVFLIGMTFGFNCGYAINPARDLGPRLFTYFAGWGSQVFTAGNGFWWIPIAGPCVGGLLGLWVYDRCITRHSVEPKKYD